MPPRTNRLPTPSPHYPGPSRPGVNRPVFRRHLVAIIHGSSRSVHEQEELNKLLMGLQVDFNFRSRFTNAGNYGRALKHGVNPVRNFIQSSGELLRGERIGPVVTREAWAWVMLPKALEDSIPWVLRIVAKRKDGREAVVAYYGHDPERGGVYFAQASLSGVGCDNGQTTIGLASRGAGLDYCTFGAAGY